MKMPTMIECASKYGKPDMERLGVFIEMPYMNGKGYVSLFPKPLVTKGRNIMCEGRKSKNGTQHGYFESEFRRLYIGEAIARPPKRKEGKKKDKAASKVPFIPAGGTKWHSTPGDHFGTFGGIISALGTGRVKPKPKKPVKVKANCLTNPGKKGGPGYADICLSKYPEHLTERGKEKKKKPEPKRAPFLSVHFPQPCFERNPFIEETHGRVYVPPKLMPMKPFSTEKWIPTGPAKWQGGCHAGLFTPFPEHKTERDPKKEKKLKQERALLKKKMEEKGKFGPQSTSFKTMNTCSIMTFKTDLCVNAQNYKAYEPVYTQYLLAKS